MIIYTEGWDNKTKGGNIAFYPMAINTKDILYARGRDSKGTSTVVYLRHNVIKETDDGTRSDPFWVVVYMPTKEFYEKWKEAEEKGE